MMIQRTAFSGFNIRKRFYYLAISLILLIVMGITYYSDTPEKINYVSLSNAEINQYIKNRNIDPIAIENIQNKTATVILFDSGVSFLSKVAKSGDITENFTTWGVGQNDVDFGVQSTGNPYVYLIINSATLIEKAYKVEVRFDDGVTVSKLVEDRRGLLLFYDKNAKNLTIGGFELYLFDKDGNILFEERG